MAERDQYWRLRMNVTGVEEVVRKLGHLTRQMKEGVRDALEEEATKIVYASRVYCPVKYGFLRASARIDISVGDKIIGVRVQYGGPEGSGNVGETNPVPVVYALAVHERLDYKHKSPTQAKFLERAFEEAKPGLRQRIANRIRRKLG